MVLLTANLQSEGAAADIAAAACAADVMKPRGCSARMPASPSGHPLRHGPFLSERSAVSGAE